MVLVSPSTVIRLKDSLTARSSARWSTGAGTAASVVRKHRVVASLGWIIPAPLAIPPTVTCAPPTVVTAAEVLGKASVVRMASAAWSPDRDSDRAARGIPRRNASMGSGTPMTPVDATST
ncbi:hypothetical protein HRbin31_00771 [bacterium HR31]|nr:hypothetical protein HRbin31_00771 [bacterium HR31]